MYASPEDTKGNLRNGVLFFINYNYYEILVSIRVYQSLNILRFILFQYH